MDELFGDGVTAGRYSADVLQNFIIFLFVLPTTSNFDMMWIPAVLLHFCVTANLNRIKKEITHPQCFEDINLNQRSVSSAKNKKMIFTTKRRTLTRGDIGSQIFTIYAKQLSFS